jgi:hypothetical protein
MKKYVVQQDFYDSGVVRIIKPREISGECLNSIEVMRSCVYCRDVFDTLEEANRFYYECLDA